MIEQYFGYKHLPPHLAEVSKIFADAIERLEAFPAWDGAERQVAKRKLLEAKDAAVRSILPAAR